MYDDLPSNKSLLKMVDVVNFLPDAAFMVDNQHRVIAWNQAIEELTGLPGADMLGRGNYEYAFHFFGIRRPMLVDLILDPNAEPGTGLRINQEKDVMIAETPVSNINGQQVFLWEKASALYDCDGNKIGAIELIRNISERKQAEMDLINSEQRLADIINFLPDPTFVIDTGHRVIAWNRAMEETTGVRAEEIMGMGDYMHGAALYGYKRPVIADIMLEPNDDLAKSYSYLERDNETLIMENPIPNWGGEEAYVWGKATLLYDSQGIVSGAIESIRDITERKKTEIALKNSEQHLAYIIDFLPDATFVIDNDHRVIAWNRAMEDLSGVEAREILGKGDYEYSVPFYGTRRPNLIDLILNPDEEEIEKYYALIIQRDKEVLIVETPALTVKGKETYLWGKASLLYDSEGNITGAIESIRDITGRKKSELEKLEAQERVARAENLASLGLMTTGLAHAIKQPLNSLVITIDSILYWFERGQDLNRDDLIEDLQKSLVRASRINEIIEHMRAFIRNEQYGESTPCNMNLSIENAYDILKAQLIAHGIEVMLDLDPNLPLVLGYENRMEEIIINLMVNAMQALDRVPGNKEKIITCISRFDGKVILEIQDQGIGISPENMDKIFEPFFSTKEGQGMGMGLFIAKSIITTLNGNIQCSSNEELTAFRIELPPYRG